MKVVDYFMSWQGEGRNTGEQTFFIRFAGCNRSCSFCDTKNSWDVNNPNHFDFTAYDLVDIVTKEVGLSSSGIPICITGGEPLLLQNDPEFLKFMKCLKNASYRVAFETNGDILASKELLDVLYPTRCLFTVSPKWENVDELTDAQFDVYDEYERFVVSYPNVNVEYKFLVDVSQNDEGIEKRMNEISSFVSQLDIPESCVWVMPITTSSDGVINLINKTSRLSEFARMFRYNISLRLHLLLGFK